MIANLLTEKLIETNRGKLSLPGLLAAKARGEVANYPALRPHQRPAWHMFLVQLAVLALAADRWSEQLPEDEETWCAALRKLTLSYTDDAPWHLVVSDCKSPAFLQPPDPGGLKWSSVATPDALDMIITSKNHDLKGGIAKDAEPQDWIFALVSLQTMEGYGGFGNYGIARMNGGSSSRAMIGLAPVSSGAGIVDPSVWWRRDVAHLLGRRSDPSVRALLWCMSWPEKEMLTLLDLDPMFIEVCRRIRLKGPLETIRAMRANSKKPRINAMDSNGVNGDPWAPVHKVDRKTLTLGEQDWTYKLLNRLFYSGEWDIPELALPLPGEEDANMILITEAFARGNSKTDGFKSRMIPVPKAIRKTMFGPQAIDLAKEQVELISGVDHALRDGLVLVAANGNWGKREKKKYEYTKSARTALSSIADALFFPALWTRLVAETEEGRIEVFNDFARKLAGAAREEFIRAAPGIPCSRIMRPRAATRGRDAFEREIGQIFRDIGVKEVEHV